MLFALSFANFPNFCWHLWWLFFGPKMLGQNLRQRKLNLKFLNTLTPITLKKRFLILPLLKFSVNEGLKTF
jgi:hypothetical protein